MLCCFLTAWSLPSKPSKIKKVESPGSPNVLRILDLDFVGTGLFVMMITSFLLFFNLGGQRLPWAHPIVISLDAGCCLSWVAFFLTEAFWAKQPLIPISLLRTNGIGLICLGQILLMCGRLSVSTLPVSSATRLLSR